MDRVVVTLPDSVPELCLVRLGLVVRRVRAFPFALKMGRAIERSSREAIEDGAGLLHSELGFKSLGHFIVLQYWSSYEALETWSHRPPHAEWWKQALERMRSRGDFGIYHETFLVPRTGVESIYLNCEPVGLLSFGIQGQAVGASTTSRNRLRRGKDGTLGRPEL